MLRLPTPHAPASTFSWQNHWKGLPAHREHRDTSHIVTQKIDTPSFESPCLNGAVASLRERSGESRRSPAPS
jgi:hypothetical protein